MLEHGGDLLRATQRYGAPPQGWLDLSTGINPQTWRGAVPSPQSWSQLPQDEDGLIEAARAYYGASQVLPVPGSQAAIQILPRLRRSGRVGVVAPAYEEHAHRWHQAGHEVELLSSNEWIHAADRFDVVVLCNPNNPTGQLHRRTQLLELHAQLAARGGWLLVDEAFIDTTPDLSLTVDSGRKGLIVLRSLGKFFGLAGARVGFVLAAPSLLAALAEWLGPWSIAGPSREVAIAALCDRDWQAAMRQDLRERSQRLTALLERCGLAPAGGCELFQWIPTPQASCIHLALARAGILTRLFAEPSSLRFGLPEQVEDWLRLETVLADMKLLKPAA